MTDVIEAVIQVDDTQTQKLKLAGNVAQTASATMVTAFNQAAAAFSRVGGMISSFTSGAVSSFAGFDQAMMNTQSIAVGTTEEFDEMRKLAGKMASEMPYYSSEIAEGYYYLSSAGFSANKILELTEPILKAATAAGTDFTTAANTLTSTLLVFEPVGYDINRIMDIMQNTVKMGKTTFDELGLTMAYVSSAGATAGVSLEDLGASIDIVRGAGLDACYDEETEVLTKKGFKKWNDVTMKDEFLTINLKNLGLEYQKPSKIFKSKYKGKM
jgi:hypothetical protein